MTGASDLPFVLIVDDDVESVTAFADLMSDYYVDALALHPRDVTADHLGRADVIVIDQFLDDWHDQPSTPLASLVPDGLSLAAVLRSHLEGTGGQSAQPRTAAFVIRTGEIDVLGAHLPRAARNHLLAAQRDLEWVFDKKEQPEPDRPGAAARVAALAQAVATLPNEWNSGGDAIESGWLALPQDRPWRGEARWQIEQCRPPRHIVAESTAGRAWLRWFLQRILPYPTFLLDDLRAATLLGLSEPEFGRVVASDSPLSRLFDVAAYTGACSTFLGRRWWRAGLTDVIAQALDDEDGPGLAEPEETAAALARLHGSPLESLRIERPVLRVNADYETLPGPIAAQDGARLQPDGWPPYADDAWADHDDLATDETLRALVVELDRWRMQSSDDDR